MESMSHYDLLGISRNANQSEILRAYKKKALQLHPDKNLGDKRCEELFKKLKKAKEDLLDPNVRENLEDESSGSVNLNAMSSGVGRKISDEFKIKINQWRKEYKNIVLVDNFHIIASTPVRITEGLLRIPDELPDDVPTTHLPYRMRLQGDLRKTLREVIPNDVWNLVNIGRQQFSYKDSATFTLNRFYSRLAHSMFSEGKFQSALFCFHKSTSERGAVELAACAKELLRSKDHANALYYYRVLLDKKGHEVEATLGILSALLNCLSQCLTQCSQCLTYQSASTNANSVHQAVFAAAHEHGKHAEFHKLALDILLDEDDLKAALECIKTILLLDTRDTSILAKRNNVEARLDRKHYDTLRELLYAFCNPEKREGGGYLLKMTTYLKTEECHSAAEKLYKEMTGDRDINQLTADFKAALYILDGYCQMQTGSYLAAEQSYLNAVISFPDGEIYEAVSRLLSKSSVEGVVQSMGVILSGHVGEHLHAHKYIGRLKLNANFKAVFRYEKSVEANQGMSNMDKAMAYLDLGMAAVDSSMLCVTFAIAANYFLQEMTALSNAEKTCDISHLYALRNAVSDLCMSGVVCARKFEQPITELHVLKQFFVLFHTANRILAKAVSSRNNRFWARAGEPVNVIRNVHKTLDTMMATSMERLVKVTPFVNLPLVLSGDMPFLDLVSCEFTKTFYETKLKENANDHPWNYLYHYQLLEGCWKSGASDSASFQKYRYNAMVALLKRKSHPVWTLEQVEATMTWSRLRRNARGFLERRNTNLQLSGPNYDFVQGVHILLKDGVPTQFQLEVVQSSKGMDGLFDNSDIIEILQSGIISTFFTLDQPEYDLDCHPFQEMKFIPAKLSGTNFLKTMLHADYLLKMLSVGCEASSRIPFEFKDVSGPGGFVTTLPVKLQNVVMPPSLRKDGQKNQSAHRFWIEAGKIPYVMTQTADKISFQFGYCPMKVKTHLLKRNADGELVDDDADNDDEITPEKEFAQDLSSHYDLIGDQFPVLLRLRELHKLAAVNLILKNIADNLKEATDSFDTATLKTKVVATLNDIRSKLEYPKNTLSELSTLFRKVLNDNGVQESQVAATEIARVKNEIRTQLQKVDNHTISHLCDEFQRAYNIPAPSNATIHELVKKWLDQNRKDDLTNLIANAVKHETMVKLSLFASYSASLGITYDGDEQDQTAWSNSNDNLCTWVPSTFHSSSPYRCYGGVMMNVALEKAVIADQQLDKRNKLYAGPGVLYTIEIFEHGILIDNWKRGISMQNKFNSETGNPARAELQLRKLQRGLNPLCPFRPEEGFSFSVKFTVFDHISTADITKLEAAKKTEDITKYGRTNLGDRDNAARKARETVKNMNNKE